MEDRNITLGDKLVARHNGSMYELIVEGHPDKDRKMVYHITEPEMGTFNSLTSACRAIVKKQIVNGWKFWLRPGETTKREARKRIRRGDAYVHHAPVLPAPVVVDKDVEDMSVMELFHSNHCFTCKGPLRGGADGHYHTRGRPARDVCCGCAGHESAPPPFVPTEHKLTKTGRKYRDRTLVRTGKEKGEMTHAEWTCSCGEGPFIGSGEASEHRRIARKRELKAWRRSSSQSVVQSTPGPSSSKSTVRTTSSSASSTRGTNKRPSSSRRSTSDSATTRRR